MTAKQRRGERIEGTVDWFEDNPTGGNAGPLGFRQVADGMWCQDIQIETGNALTVDHAFGAGLLVPPPDHS